MNLTPVQGSMLGMASGTFAIVIMTIALTLWANSQQETPQRRKPHRSR